MEMVLTNAKLEKAGTAKRGFSLVEMIVTSLLVGVIVIGVVPLFTRAVSNNIYGADASQLASFLRSGAERVQQRSAGDAAFREESSNVGTNPTGDASVDPDDYVFTDETALRSIPMFYDTGVRDSITKADLQLGDEAWLEEGEAPAGIFLWRQRREIREYSVADVFRGNISVDSSAGSSTLSPLGNPKLFDTPQPLSGLSDIKEIRMIVESSKGSIGTDTGATPTGFKQKATVMTYRAF